MAFTGKLGAFRSRPGNIVLGEGAITAPLSGGTGSFVLSATLTDTQTGTFGLDAALAAATTSAFSVDAILRPTGSGVFTLNSITRATQSGSFSLNASILIPPIQHDRIDFHYGTQDDIYIVLGAQIDNYAIGTDLHTVLADLFGRVDGLSYDPGSVSRFVLSAWVQPYFTIEAVLQETTTASLGLDARVAIGGSIAINAIFKEVRVPTVTLAASIHDFADTYLNLVRFPVGGTATYSSPNTNGERAMYDGPQFAADGLKTAGEFFIQGSSVYGLVNPVFRAVSIWNETTQEYEWTDTPQWVCTWSTPQTIDTIKFYDGGGHTEGFTSYDWHWGNTGTIEFSDGSVIPWAGLPNNGFHVEQFAPKTVTWFKVTTSDYNPDPLFGQALVLVEVEAYLTGLL